jgi:endoglucanase
MQRTQLVLERRQRSTRVVLPRSHGTGEVCSWNTTITNLQTPFLIGEFQPWTELGRNGGEITRKTFDIYSMYGWASTAWSYKTTSQSGNNGDGNTGWPWGIVTNTTGYGDINVSTASAAQIESWFRQFATQGLWLEYRVASPTGGTVILGRDGVDLATTAVPNTAGYQNWQTVSTTVSLQAGTQFLTVYVQAGGWNFNWWRLTPL